MAGQNLKSETIFLSSALSPVEIEMYRMLALNGAVALMATFTMSAANVCHYCICAQGSIELSRYC